MKILLIYFICLILSSCGNREKYAPLPKTDLKARNEALEEVEAKLALLKTASPATAVSLLDHPDHRVRRAAVKRLGTLRKAPDEAVNALLSSLEDENSDVRIEAAIALTVIEIDTAVLPLIRALVDENSKVRQWAYKALKKLGAKAVPEMVRQISGESEGGNTLPSQLANKNADIHKILIETLSGMGKAAVPYLIKAIENNRDASAKEAVQLLGKLGKDAKESIYVLLEILNTSSDVELKKSAITTISLIGDVDPEVVPTLWNITEGDNNALAEAARKALVKLEENS